ncbi:hypothetical protein D9M71_767430 [compost metagenome]
MDEQVELTPVGQPRQRVFQSQQFQAAIDLEQFVLSVQQLVLNAVLLLHQIDQAKTQYTDKTQQKRNDASTEHGFLTPAGQDFLPVERGENNQRIPLDPAKPHHPHNAIHHGFECCRP